MEGHRTGPARRQTAHAVAAVAQTRLPIPRRAVPVTRNAISSEIRKKQAQEPTKLIQVNTRDEG